MSALTRKYFLVSGEREERGLKRLKKWDKRESAFKPENVISSANGDYLMTENHSTGSAPDTMPLPEVSFSTFILSLASSALAQLGEVPLPESGRLEKNLTLAKHGIDVLEMLRRKTESNLDEQERRLLEGVLYELRLKYVIQSGKP